MGQKSFGCSMETGSTSGCRGTGHAWNQSGATAGQSHVWRSSALPPPSSWKLGLVFPSLRSSGFPGLEGPRGSVAGWEEYSFGFCTERQSGIIAPCLPQGLTPCLAGSWMLAGTLREQIPAWAQPRRAARHTVTDPSESNTPMWARMLRG